MRAEELARRLRELERGQALRYEPDKPKRKWEKTRCPKCGYEIKFEPKPTWDGKLKCPTCGEIFRVSRLDDFVGEEDGRRPSTQPPR